MRKESKGYNTIIFIYLQEFNGEVGAIAIKDEYPLLSPLLCSFVASIKL
jgi:hypothetical protein